MSKVTVLGSLNMDVVVGSDAFPKVGETIMGNSLSYFLGGKGANQAVAASRMGISTTLLGSVGDDAFGRQLLTGLSKEALNLTEVAIQNDAPTGTAVVTQAAGDNSIVVIAGANAKTDEKYVREQRELIAETTVLLAQLEIPLKSLVEGFKIAKANQVITILNPAPYNEALVSLLPLVDYLTPNETEFFELVASFKKPGEIEADLLFLNETLNTKLIVTRGEHGVSYVENHQVKTVATIPVKVKDTTGAGDTFNGILAAYLAEAYPLAEAIKAASVGASLAVEAEGAQRGMPFKEAVVTKLQTLEN